MYTFLNLDVLKQLWEKLVLLKVNKGLNLMLCAVF